MGRRSRQLVYTNATNIIQTFIVPRTDDTIVSIATFTEINMCVWLWSYTGYLVFLLTAALSAAAPTIGDVVVECFFQCYDTKSLRATYDTTQLTIKE